MELAERIDICRLRQRGDGVLERLDGMDALGFLGLFGRFFARFLGRFFCCLAVFLRSLLLVLFRLRLLGLFLVSRILLEVERLDVRLVLRIRHRPERQHVLNRRDEECIGRHFLEAGRDGADELAVDVDGTAAHALQDAARRLDDGAGGLRHDHRRRAFAVIDRADDVHLEIANLARMIDDRVGRAFHARRDLACLPDFRHGVCREERTAPECRSNPKRGNMFQIPMQNFTPLCLLLMSCYPTGFISFSVRLHYSILRTACKQERWISFHRCDVSAAG